MRVSALIKPMALGLTALACAITLSNVQAAPITWNGWTLDYEVGVNNDGLALKNVKYQTHTLLKKISLSSISVGEDFNAAGAPCGIAYTDQLDSTLQPMYWANNATVSQRQFTKDGRQWLEIGIYEIKDNSRQYFQAYYLSQDGLFDAHLYAYNGWRCVEREVRNPNWRVDLDVDGAATDVLESGLTSYTARTTEFNDSDYALDTFWRVRDTVTNSSVYINKVGFNFSHPDGNPTQYPTSYYDSFAKYTSGILYKASEDIDVLTGTLNLLNGENILSKDVVTWVDGMLTAEFAYRNNDVSTMWFTSSLSLVPSWTQTLPDVVVDEFSYDDNGGFNVVVHNIGTTTPAGKAIGVGISVDGNYRTYVATGTPLLPGERRLLTSTMFNRYYIPAGNHIVTAWVDDVNRFAESNENNNQQSKSIAVSGALVSITAPAKNATVSGASVVFSARAISTGFAIGGVSFYVDDEFIGSKYSAPYTITWDSTTIPAGKHLLTAVSGDYGKSGVVFNVTSALAQKPDLVVTSLGYANGKFSCTIKNQGTGDIPAAGWFGLSYYVDGVYKTWSATFGPLAAGASMSLGTLGASYTIPAGTHTIKVVADDQSSIAEASETNNQLSQTITVP